MTGETRVDELIYKILRRDEWLTFLAAGRFDGSPADKRDGYIHFSGFRQVAGTLKRHYADEQTVALVSVRANALSSDLRWEASRNNDLFPHLYGPLMLDQVAAVTWIDPCSQGDEELGFKASRHQVEGTTLLASPQLSCG